MLFGIVGPSILARARISSACKGYRPSISHEVDWALRKRRPCVLLLLSKVGIFGCLVHDECLRQAAYFLLNEVLLPLIRQSRSLDHEPSSGPGH